MSDPTGGSVKYSIIEIKWVGLFLTRFELTFRCICIEIAHLRSALCGKSEVFVLVHRLPARGGLSGEKYQQAFLEYLPSIH